MLANKGSSRRGFRFAKGKDVAESEDLSYEEADASTSAKSTSRMSSSNNNTATQGKAKRGRPGKVSSGAESLPANKKRNTSTENDRSIGSTCSSSRALAQRVPSDDPPVAASKSHYPKVDFQVSERLRTDTKSKHSSKLSDVVLDICRTEQDVLEKGSVLARSDGLKNKAAVYELLVDTLKSIPAGVHASCPVDATFAPELSRDEILELQSLIASRDLLKKHLEKLTEYEEDVTKLEKDCDVWLKSTSISSSSSSSSSSQIHKVLGGAEGPEGVAQKYTALLEALDADCDKVLQSTSDAKALMSQASMRQARLYDTFTQIRAECAQDVSAPKDTRDLIRQMPNLF